VFALPSERKGTGGSVLVVVPRPRQLLESRIFELFELAWSKELGTVVGTAVDSLFLT
jgi:hypothetical protein